MEKKNLIVNIILFIILTSLEIGIIVEVVWHGWGGFGDPSLEYTKKGEIGTDFLVFFIPVSTIVVFLIRIITLCKKKIHNMKELLFFDCIGAVFGIVIGYVSFTFADTNPFFLLGRWVTAFLIDYFNWMTYPAP